MKIKVVDVDTQPQGVEQLATIDEAEEDYNSSKTLSNSSKEEDVPEQKEEEEHVLPEYTTPTKQRVQQLHKCEKCGKMLTLKSLRYSHSKYCGKVSEPVETKMKPEPKVRSTPVSEPAPVMPGGHTERVKDPFVPPIKEKTFDEMRKERMEQRRAAQKESIQKLFARAV